MLFAVPYPAKSKTVSPRLMHDCQKNRFRLVLHMSRSESTLFFLQLVHFVNKDAIGLARDFVTLGFLPRQTGNGPIRTLIIHSSSWKLCFCRILRLTHGVAISSPEGCPL
jgi:hypothetical protein